MDRFDRIYRLYTLFTTSREARSAASLQADLGCSRATLMRAIAELRELLGTPLVWDGAARGYRLDGATSVRSCPDYGSRPMNCRPCYWPRTCCPGSAKA